MKLSELLIDEIKKEILKQLSHTQYDDNTDVNETEVVSIDGICVTVKDTLFVDLGEESE